MRWTAYQYNKMEIIQMHSIRSLLLQINFQICFKNLSPERLGSYGADGGLEGILAQREFT